MYDSYVHLLIIAVDMQVYSYQGGGGGERGAILNSGAQPPPNNYYRLCTQTVNHLCKASS